MHGASEARVTRSPLPLSRWSWLLAAALAEGLFLTSRFDLPAWSREHGAWQGLVAITPFVLPATIAIATAWFLFASPRVQAGLGPYALQRLDSHRPARFALLHGLCFAAFALATASLFRSTTAPNGLAIATWLTLGAANLATWVACAVPPAALWRVGRRHAGLLASTAGVGVAAWFAGRMADRGLWEPLGATTLTGVHTLLGWLVDSTTFDAATRTVGTSEFLVEVGQGCSGWEGIGLMWVFLGFALVAFRDSLRFPHAWALVPIGTAAMWCANVVRIVLLILIGHAYSAELAVGAFHTRAGWVFFCAVAIGLLTLARRSRVFAILPDATSARADAPPRALGPDRTPAYLVPLLLWLSIELVFGAVLERQDVIDLARIVAAGAALIAFRHAYRGQGWHVSHGSAALAIAVGVGVYFLWQTSAPAVSGATRDAVFALSPTEATLWLSVRALGTVVIVPLVEELAFRDFLTRRLRSARFESVPLGEFSPLPFVASAVLFGALHSNWVGGTLAGLAYGALVCRERRLLPAVIAHATTNGLIVASALTTGEYGTWL